MRRSLSLLFGILTGWTAGLAGELPIENFFRNYQYNEVRLSPDGRYLAALAPIKERVGLAVVDLKTRVANWAYSDRSADIQWFEWVNTNRLIFRFSKDAHLVAGLLAVNRDGSNKRTLVNINDSRTHFFRVLPDEPDEILVTSVAYSTTDSETGWRYPNVARMNVFTGSMTREVTNPGRVFAWLTDHKGVVRIGVAFEGTRFNILHRAGTNGVWETAESFNYDEDGLWPMGFDYDNRTLFVRHYGDRETEGVYTYDLAQKKLKELGFRHADADVERLIFSEKEQALAGVWCHTDRPEVFWFSPQQKRIQASVDRALPGTLNFPVSSSRDESRTVILAANDRTPGTFYLLNTSTLKMEKLFDLADWIKAEDMAAMQPIQYKARDGLTIRGYLTVPKGSSGKNLPLIVNPHGGPGARDVWGFDPEVQFLANRGYAVLRMNFRGSTGYGRAFREAGYKQWGLKQQDDITDGVKWAVEQGIADPKRICIFGASYGGFAALTGLEQTPELYRCAISYAGVTDIRRTLKHSVPDLELARILAAETIGDAKKEKERFEATSPLNNVDKIQVPVLLAYGVLDPRVPISTGRDMAKALKKRGKLYDFIEKDDEGHGFFKQENKLELWKKIDVFLKENLK